MGPLRAIPIEGRHRAAAEAGGSQVAALGGRNGSRELIRRPRPARALHRLLSTDLTRPSWRPAPGPARLGAWLWASEGRSDPELGAGKPPNERRKCELDVRTDSEQFPLPSAG